MAQEKKVIIVPWDATENCFFALQHAASFARKLDNEVLVLKFKCKKKTGPEKFKKAIDEVKNSGVEVTVKEGEGTIFHLPENLEKFNVSLVVLRSEPVKGMQKYFGSRTLKIIHGSTHPFLVVKGAPRREEYANIVFPIDYTFESKEKLHWIKWLAKIYKTQIQIITPDITDGVLRQKIKNNVIFAKNILNDEDINFEIIVGAGKGEFGKAIMNFANKVEADLIMSMMPKDVGFKDYLSGATTQRILDNPYNVPVFLINSRKLRKYGGFR